MYVIYRVLLSRSDIQDLLMKISLFAILLGFSSVATYCAQLQAYHLRRESITIDMDVTESRVRLHMAEA